MRIRSICFVVVSFWSLNAHASPLEHIPSASNRGDSQRSVDERVWRP